MGENFSSVFRAALDISPVSTNNTSLDTDDFQSLQKKWQFLMYLGDARVVMTLLLPPVLYLSFLPNLKVLAPSIALATIFMFASFFLIGLVIESNWSSGVVRWREEMEEASANSGRLKFLGNVDWDLVPLATCAIMYSLEGDQLILPIEAAMAHPDQFEKVFVISMGLIGLLFCIFGSLCVVSFGHVDDGSVTAFLLDHHADLVEFNSGTNHHGYPAGLSTVQIVLVTNVIVSLSLLFTYPLQLFPAIGLMGQIVALRQEESKGVKENCDNEDEQLRESTSLLETGSAPPNAIEDLDRESLISEKKYAPSINDNNSPDFASAYDEEYLVIDEEEHADMSLQGDSVMLRSCLVVLTYLVAILVPHLKTLIALAGAITGSATSLIIPPILALRFVVADLITSQKEITENKSWKCCMTALVDNALHWKKIIFFMLLIVVGFIYAILGTISSIEDIIRTYTEKNLSS